MRSPYAGAIEEPGQGVRADIDGKEARLGSAELLRHCQTPRMRRTAAMRPSLPSLMMARRVTIPIRQTLRPDAVAVIDALRERGFDLIILSGDRPDAVAPIAKGLGIRTGKRRLKPAEKIASIEAAESRKAIAS